MASVKYQYRRVPLVKTVTGEALAWGKVILLDLLKLTDELLYTYFSTKYKGVAWLPKRRPLEYYQARYRLVRANLIKKSVSSPKGYALTTQGRNRAIEILLQLRPKQTPHWDGRWRVVIFDVPEQRRHDRHFLRRQLKAMDFQLLHKSVWVSPYDPPPFFHKLLSASKLLNNSRVLLVESMDYDRDLRRHFGLTLKRFKK